jgi:omega-amidase
MKIAAIQMDLAWEDRATNYRRARRFAEQAASSGADLIVLPEMFPTAFSLDTSVTAEPLDGPTATFYRSMARDLNVAVAGGFVLENNGGKPHNVSLAVDRSGNDLALYRKIHLIGVLQEDAFYAPGTWPAPFDLEGTGTACLVCYDLRFPELFRMIVDACRLILVIASWPSSRQTHWDLLLRARAIECQCFVAGVNRVGQGGGLDFTGGSAIIDPTGEIIAHGGEAEGPVLGDIDPKQADRLRSEFPVLKDRRAHLFEKLAQGATQKGIDRSMGKVTLE